MRQRLRQFLQIGQILCEILMILYLILAFAQVQLHGRFLSPPIAWLEGYRLSWNLDSDVKAVVPRYNGASPLYQDSAIPHRYLLVELLATPHASRNKIRLDCQINFWSRNRLESLGVLPYGSKKNVTRIVPEIRYDGTRSEESCLLYGAGGYYLYATSSVPDQMSRSILGRWFSSFRIHTPKSRRKSHGPT